MAAAAKEITCGAVMTIVKGYRADASVAGQTRGLEVHKGEKVEVDWARSKWGWLFARQKNGVSGLLPADCAKLENPDYLSGDYEDEYLWMFDALLGERADATIDAADVDIEDSGGKVSPDDNERGGGHGGGSFKLSAFFQFQEEIPETPSECPGTLKAARVRMESDVPPVLEPGLRSYVWPLTREEFMENIWKQRAFSVGGCPDRVQQVVKDFYAGDVDSLIAHASNTVVWMKSLEGQMQHFYAEPAFAAQAYQAGHTLYFNHPRELQKRYIKAVCRELGFDFGLEQDGGFGGDVEVFACNTRHLTDWHLDAQENFTIQLRGTKKWTFMPGVSSPVTNCITPTNTYQAGYNVQKMCHRYYAENERGGPNLPPTDFSRARTVYLRPGSILYVPAGWWHKVECDCDDGSLSINYSLNSRAYLDVLQDHLLPLLWRHRSWRDNIVVDSPEATRKRLGSLLESLQTELASLSPERMLPPVAFLEGRIKRVDLTVPAPWTLPPEPAFVGSVLCKNPLSVLFLSDREELEWAHSQDRNASQLLDCSRLQKLEGEGFSRKRARSEAAAVRTVAVDSSSSALTYRVHQGFGNANFVPLVTFELCVPESFRSIMSFLESRVRETAFETADLYSQLSASSMTPVLKAIIQCLFYCGYLENSKEHKHDQVKTY